MTPGHYHALRRHIATRARCGARSWSRVAILEAAAASGCPCRIARAVACGWTPTGYTLLTSGART